VSVAFNVFIPARYRSSRLPGKPLLMIGDKTLIQHVYESACSSKADRVIIATDDDRIDDVARSFGATVIMTSPAHQSGTDRIYEAAAKLGLPDDEIIVNVQGDEFGLDPETVNQVATVLADNPDVQMATLCEKIMDKQIYLDPNSVKVVMDRKGRALYFSRASIPVQPGGDIDVNHKRSLGYKHIGIYAYRTGFLATFAGLPKADLEISESLEQLRALYHGYSIHVAEITVKTGIEINTPEDLILARNKTGAGEWGTGS